MSDDDMIRRGDAKTIARIAAHPIGPRENWSEMEAGRARAVDLACEAINTIHAVQVGVKPLPHGSAEFDAALSDYTPGIDRAVRFVSIDQVDMLAEFYLQNRSTLTAQPSPDVAALPAHIVVRDAVQTDGHIAIRNLDQDDDDLGLCLIPREHIDGLIAALARLKGGAA